MHTSFGALALGMKNPRPAMPSVREHVQRLDRILHPRDSKRTVLYELVTAGTTETFTNARRRDHSAYH